MLSLLTVIVFLMSMAPLEFQRRIINNGLGNADIGIWVRGHRQVFVSYGACKEKDGGYDCTGHDLANEHRNCARSTPGVHGCRAPAIADKFRLDTQPDELLLSVPQGLELSASETGPYLNLMGSDSANNSFLLQPERSCRSSAQQH